MDLDRYFIIPTKYLKLLSETQLNNLAEIELTVKNVRTALGKLEEPEYYVCKQEEPYADSVRDMIMAGEESKKQLKIEIVKTGMDSHTVKLINDVEEGFNVSDWVSGGDKFNPPEQFCDDKE